ncbi:MAG TPA: hypothetical protein VF147_02000, partial [Vicinamibacterales bacterium]
MHRSIVVALAFTLAGASASAQVAPAPVQWGSVVKAEAQAGRVTKTSGCDGCADAGGVSAHLVSTDGGIEFTTVLGYRVFGGLTDADGVLPSVSTLRYAFSFWPDGGWDIREAGVYKKEGRFVAGDVFSIRASAGVVAYAVNGRVVYTSATPMTAPLRFGALLLTKNASLGSAGIATPAAGPAVTAYGTVTDRTARVEPMLPVPGIAGSAVTDPTFGTTIVRVTDALTRPSKPGRSFRTPSGTHQHAWSALGTFFYVVSNDGTVIPYAFDGRTGQASRIQPSATGAGGLTLKFYNEAQFSYVNDSQIYATYNGSGATLRTIDQYDFGTNVYTRLLDLDTLAPGLTGTYVGGVNSSAGPVERIVAFFGGTGQDRHHFV